MKSRIKLYIGVGAIVTIVAFLLGFTKKEGYEYWFLIGDGILAVLIFLSITIYKLIKNRKIIKENGDEETGKKPREIKITPKEQREKLINLLREVHFDEVKEFMNGYGSVENRGSGEASPINTIIAKSTYEKGRLYYYLMNLCNPIYESLLTFDSNNDDREEFKKELNIAKNYLAETPSTEQEITRGLDEFGRPIIKVKKISKAEKEEKEKEKQQEEIEGWGE